MTTNTKNHPFGRQIQKLLIQTRELSRLLLLTLAVLALWDNPPAFAQPANQIVDGDAFIKLGNAFGAVTDNSIISYGSTATGTTFNDSDLIAL